MSEKYKELNYKKYDGYDEVSEKPKCDVCGRFSDNCAAYELRGRGVFRICPHCLVLPDSEEVAFVTTFGKLIRKK